MAGIIKIDNIFFTSEGFIILHAGTFYLFVSYLKWVFVLKKKYKFSKYSLRNRCVMIDNRDVSFLLPLKQSSNYKYLHIYFYKLLKISKKKMLNLFEKNNVTFNISTNPLETNNYSYRFFDVRITSKKKLKIIETDSDNFLSAILVCFEYETIYAMNNISIKYSIFLDKYKIVLDSSTNITDLILKILNIEFSFIIIKVFELNDWASPQDILLPNNYSFSDVRLKII